ncbi:DUF1772 domain-containing protein [Aspergillus saccharolyticus JOP 1030-1]|uniref:DUF1772-domain-containing protein n=1 Tax=Aspergillus saccharolyticus JOP 1030-1 TaxID=1450539 RepID=A0A318ZHG9_9EURO|nr:DUF1772-domain-containing protein [Aspergillus saccharolyticus JOP 1030-1]PYH47016.1 DUF1772-domain-containing protein [Aspergillus saccharolyticus JOP 1030-1]
MSPSASSFAIAQAVGLTGAAWLSGNIFSLSLMGMPPLIETHHTENIPLSSVVKQWRTIYTYGAQRAPSIGLCTAATFFYLAWSVRESTPLSLITARNSSQVYCLAGALTLGIVPFTIVFMKKTNDRLTQWAQHRAEEAWTAEADAEVEGLLWKWTWLNAVRSVFPLLGGLVGLGVFA